MSRASHAPEAAKRTTAVVPGHDRATSTGAGSKVDGPRRRAGHVGEADAPVRSVRGSLLLAALIVCLGTTAVALVGGGGAPQPAPAGLPDAGRATMWALQAAVVGYQLAAVVAVGSLLTGVVLVPADGSALHGYGRVAVRATTWWAAGWAVLAAAAGALTVADIVGVPVTELVSDTGLWSQFATLQQPRALLLSAAVATVVAAYTRWVRTTAGGWLLLATAVVALTPTLFTGHSAQAADHNLATTSLVVHVVAATGWVGGLVGVGLYLRRDVSALAAAVPGFSVLALACFVLVGTSGLVNAWTRLGWSVESWTSGYGALVLAKVAAFAVLGAMGWAHRRRSLRALVSGSPRGFLRLAAGEVLVMAAAVGLAVALARTPTPLRPSDVVAVPAHGAGHETLAATIEPFSAGRLLTQWQPDAIALAVAGVAMVLYAYALRSLARTGEHWPASRTAAFAAGTAVLVFATCGGLAVYAPAMFSVHVARFLILSLAVPLLIVVGRPLRLAQLVRPARPGSLRSLLGSGALGAALANPVNGFMAYVVVTYGLYATPLLDQSLRSVPAHLLASSAAVAAGLVLVSALVTPEAAVSRGRQVAVVAALTLFLVVFALILFTREALYAPGWFGELRFSWVNPLPDQRRGAAVMALGLPVITPLLLLAVWFGRPAAVGDAAPTAARTTSA